MSDDSDPPRKFYRLKPKDFEMVNEPTSAAPADSSPTHVRGHLRAAFSSPPPSAITPQPQANDVHALLRDNVARANAAGLNELTAVRARRSRRKRDYWRLMALGTIILGGIAALTGPRMPIPFIYAIAGVVLFNLGLWWIMWHVMEDY
jgi:hypothetical protein